MYKRLERIFSIIFGNSVRGVSEKGQSQFDCPFCDGVGKGNMEINFPKGVYSAWCCPTESGKLSYLIKQFGNEQLLKEYHQEIANIRESRLYQLNFTVDDFEKPPVVLPKCCLPINKQFSEHIEGYHYLLNRGLNEDDIKRNEIHCTGNVCSSCTINCKYRYNIRNRIIFINRSFGNIDYWVGRLYRESKNKTKYLLPSNSNKIDIIWKGNGEIQWDGEVRLCEGVFDSMVIPNSIPILGKKLNSEFRLFNVLLERANSVLLIPDYEEQAYNDWVNIYDSLNVGRLKGKVRLVDWFMLSLPPDCNDVSDLYRIKGKKGVIELLRTANF